MLPGPEVVRFGERHEVEGLPVVIGPSEIDRTGDVTMLTEDSNESEVRLMRGRETGNEPAPDGTAKHDETLSAGDQVRGAAEDVVVLVLVGPCERMGGAGACQGGQSEAHHRIVGRE